MAPNALYNNHNPKEKGAFRHGIIVDNDVMPD
jgi:hypothetical protein